LIWNLRNCDYEKLYVFPYVPFKLENRATYNRQILKIAHERTSGNVVRQKELIVLRNVDDRRSRQIPLKRRRILMPHPWSTLENLIRNSSRKFKSTRTIVDRVFTKPFEENE